MIVLEPDNFELPVEGSPEETVVITPPCAHTGPGPVKVRLISHAVREGMVVGNSLSVYAAEHGNLIINVLIVVIFSSCKILYCFIVHVFVLQSFI